MTTVAVLADPPRPGRVLTGLPESAPLSAAEAADLYAAMFRDVVAGVAASGGDLLVNYRAAREGLDAVDGATGGDREEDGGGDGRDDAEDALRREVERALGSAADVRFEIQVGQTFAGRAGNTLAHLLREEGVGSAAVVEPTAPFVSRPIVDGAAMKLRSSAVVLGPAPGGRIYYAAFADTVDFQDAWATPAVRTLTERGVAAGHDVDFVERLPVVETGADLADALALLEARRAAGRSVPGETTGVLREFGLTVEATGGGELALTRE